MKLLFKKAFRDLLKDKKRVFMAFLAILIGTSCFGITLFSAEIINREIVSEYESIAPSSGTIYVNKVDDKLIHLTEKFKAITTFEEKAFYEFATPSENGQKTVQLFSHRDYLKIKLNKIFSESGDFPPSEGAFLIEKDSLSVAGTKLGDSISINSPTGESWSFPLSGVVSDINRHPAKIHQWIYLYASQETLHSMGLANNQIDFVVAGDPFDRNNILSVSNDYVKLLRENGYEVQKLEISDTPGISMHLEEYASALLLLRLFAILGFLFGVLIMSNLISSVLKGQIKQIGILKSFGTDTKKILLAYSLALFAIILSVSVISLILAGVTSKNVSIFLLSIANLYPHNTAVSVSFYLLFFLLSVVTPMLISFNMIRRGVKITVKEALQNYGIPSHNTVNLNLPFLRRPTLLSIRNALLVKKRFLLNVLMLTFGGVLLLSLVSSMFSLQNTLTDYGNTLHYNYQIVTPNIEHKNLTHTLDTMTHVKKYEVWSLSGTTIVNESGDLTGEYTLVAPQADSQMISPHMLEGSWLNNQPGGIVVSQSFLSENPDYSLGSSILLKVGTNSKPFMISGVLNDLGESSFYMNPPDFHDFVSSENSLLSIKMIAETTGRAKKMYAGIQNDLENSNLIILQSESKQQMQETLTAHFSVTLQTFLLVICMIIVIACFGLASTMMMQTAERTKEIAVMKAIGASKKQIIRIITAESLFIALVSFVLSVAIAIPFGFFALTILETFVFEMLLSFSIITFVLSTIIWLLLLLVVAYCASSSSAKTVANQTIKEALTFE